MDLSQNTQEYWRQHRLRQAVRDFNAPLIQQLMAHEKHATDDLVVLALSNRGRVVSPAARQTFDALMAGWPEEAAPPLRAMEKALAHGDEEYLDQLLLRMPEGVEQEMPGVRSMIGIVLNGLANPSNSTDPSDAKHLLTALRWLLAHEPRLDRTHECWEPLARPPLANACAAYRFHEHSRPWLRPSLAMAIDDLLKAGAPLISPRDDHTLKTLSVLAGSMEHPAWLSAVASSGLPTHWVEKLSRELLGEAKARWNQILLNGALPATSVRHVPRF